ncbi:MAG: xanthine dehydrogenase family protein molybdopterin-binding subunit [Holophaga sp.]|nr:xanthine dehydrogenase family protein molybdopterin-binding subunit [Holophaga sp.]
MKNEGIGISVPRREGREKLTGKALYVADQVWPERIYGVTVRSKVAHGRILGIRFGEGIPWPEFTIVTAKDIEAMGWYNRVESVAPDQPFLAEEIIRHAEEPVLLLAHPDRHLLERARRAVTVEVEELPAVLDIDEALACVQRVGGRNNLFKEIRIEKGDPDGVWAQAAHVVEGEYHTGAQEQLYIETNGMTAEVRHGEEGPDVTVRGSLQCPYYVHTALTQLFHLPGPRVRVLQMETGGAFGGKEDYPSIIAGHAALLAWKAGRPVTIVYDREEDMACTTKRHPSRSRLRTAFDADGRLLAMETDFVLDAGAYTTLSPVVLSRGAIHALGPYRCPHVRIHARAVATHTPPNGAFRGFGAPQSLFAMERHMDIAAARMGIDPVLLRRRNLLKEGDLMATGQRVTEALDLPGLMDRALADLGYQGKLAAFARHNAGPSRIKKGVGFSVFMHGCGFTGSGEQHLASVTGVRTMADGRVEVLAASTEMGQGKETVFTQIVSEALGVPNDLVRISGADTREVPNSGPTVASRSTMVVGRLVADAATGLRQMLVERQFLREPYDPEGFRAAVRRAHAAGVLTCFSEYQQPANLVWDDQTYRGDAYPTFAWACYAVEVSVDTVTWEVKVEDFVARQEVGRVINPILAAGQVEGGVTQGLGWALWEKVETAQGRMVNNQMTNYIVATAQDLPRIRVYFEENNPYALGPGGAKGLGELPMDGPAPAVLGAIQNALGLLDLRQLPVTPERLLEAVEADHGGE